MTDEKPTASGNRWEPADDQSIDRSIDQSADQSAEQSTEQSTQQSTGTWVATPEPVPASSTWLSRTRTAVAGGAAAVLLAGGLGGFAIARATGDSEGPDGADQHQGVPTGMDQDGDDDGRSFDRGPGPGGPGPGPGQPGDADDDGTDGSDT